MALANPLIPDVLTALAGWLVATWTIALPVVFAAGVSLVGLKVQAALAGNDPQLKVNMPVDPPSAVSTRV